MDILKIFRPAPPRTAAELRTALEQTAAARREAEADLQRLGEARAEALLSGSDSQVDEIEAKQLATSRTLDRCCAALGELRRRLAAAEQAEAENARAKAWAALSKKHTAAAKAFEKAATEALSAFQDLTALFVEADRYGFVAEANACFARPPALSGGALALSDELIGRYRSELCRIADAAKALKPAVVKGRPASREQVGAMYRGISVSPPPDLSKFPTEAELDAEFGPPATTSGPVQPMPSKPLPAQASQAARPSDADVPGAKLRQPPRPLLVLGGPVPNGQMAIQLLRSGVELPGGILSRIGDVVSLEADAARTLVMAGAADLFTPTPPADNGAPSEEKEAAE